MKTDEQTQNGGGPLSGLTVLDLSRILAGPTATQLLGDLGAEIIKIERPGKGDDTRAWGPPFLQDAEGNDTEESAYYLSSNRNKKSVAINLANEEGRELIRQLADSADILVENFKVGDLARHGLDYKSLSQRNARLIYCSISGFGQTGPYAPRAGYDFLIQGMGGIMSITGDPVDQANSTGPMKVGVGIADVMCGMYATVGILAALEARHKTGTGQHIDISLLDTQVAWLVNQGASYLVSGETPVPLGNGHPTIVPYETFPGSDKAFILAVGNDGQFSKFCAVAGAEHLSSDKRFARNVDRVRNRDVLVPLLQGLTRKKSASEWIELLESAGVPCGPINTIPEAFADPQIQHREMKVEMPHPTSGSGSVSLIGNPLKLSKTPVQYDRPPPIRGADTKTVLASKLHLSEEEIAELAAAGVVEDKKI
ncbi:CaiB/BaiF CoA-transferase family protein [Parvibaculaceae bacterium PLY_AMNH_Bact1]|nr:CaiB/BaiF CoA-transferase family protein [Parvibaculaceae bacterium PLY_AMNH_Bact1]